MNYHQRIEISRLLGTRQAKSELIGTLTPRRIENTSVSTLMEARCNYQYNDVPERDLLL